MFRQIDSPQKNITIYIDDRPYAAATGDSIATILLNNGLSAVHVAPDSTLRGPYCMMGVCFDCMIALEDGRIEQACQTYAEDGMRALLLMTRKDEAG